MLGRPRARPAGGDLDEGRGRRRSGARTRRFWSRRSWTSRRRGRPAGVRAHGFVRLAWCDDMDGSRAVLPRLPAARLSSRPARPLIVQLHGYNPANPVYVRWWAVDSRHHAMQARRPGRRRPRVHRAPRPRQHVLPRLRGEGRAPGDRRGEEALAIDEDRVTLMGDSMGGWGTWQSAPATPSSSRRSRPSSAGPTTARSSRGRPREAHAGRAVPPGAAQLLGAGGGAAQPADPRLARRRRQSGQRRLLALGGEDAPALGLRRALPRAAGPRPRGHEGPAGNLVEWLLQHRRAGPPAARARARGRPAIGPRLLGAPRPARSGRWTSWWPTPR